MVNKGGSPNIRTSAAQARMEAREARLIALQHVMKLAQFNRKAEVMPWIMVQTMNDKRLMGITLAQLDTAMTGATHHKAIKVIRETRKALHDSTNKADGYLTLTWLFDIEDQGCRLAAWLTKISERDNNFKLQTPQGFPYEQIFNPGDNTHE